MTIVRRNLEYSWMFQCLPCLSFIFEHPLCDKNFSLLGEQNGICSLNKSFVKLLNHIGHENDGSAKYKNIAKFTRISGNSNTASPFSIKVVIKPKYQAFLSLFSDIASSVYQIKNVPCIWSCKISSYFLFFSFYKTFNLPTGLFLKHSSKTTNV